jgi:hypothetical protein
MCVIPTSHWLIQGRDSITTIVLTRSKSGALSPRALHPYHCWGIPHPCKCKSAAAEQLQRIRTTSHLFVLLPASTAPAGGTHLYAALSAFRAAAFFAAFFSRTLAADTAPLRYWWCWLHSARSTSARESAAPSMWSTSVALSPHRRALPARRGYVSASRGRQPVSWPIRPRHAASPFPCRQTRGHHRPSGSVMFQVHRPPSRLITYGTIRLDHPAGRATFRQPSARALIAHHQQQHQQHQQHQQQPHHSGSRAGMPPGLPERTRHAVQSRAASDDHGTPPAAHQPR